jgi:hypothetical protein
LVVWQKWNRLHGTYSMPPPDAGLRFRYSTLEDRLYNCQGWDGVSEFGAILWNAKRGHFKNIAKAENKTQAGPELCGPGGILQRQCRMPRGEYGMALGFNVHSVLIGTSGLRDRRSRLR